MAYKQHRAGDGGWSKWVSPKPGSPYKMACCDCGLVHELEFNAVKVESVTPNGWWKGEDLPFPFRVLFRARRNNRATAQIRRRDKLASGATCLPQALSTEGKGHD